MPHYVTKLGEKFLLPIMQIFNLEESLLGIQKLFGALASGGERRTKTLNRADNSYFSFLNSFS